MKLWEWLALGSVVALMPSAAQAQGQSFPVTPGQAYKHQPSGFEVGTTAAGLSRRSEGKRYQGDDLDVSFAFADEGGGEITTIYIFRRTNGSLPVWFDRAQVAAQENKDLGSATLAIAPAAFIPAGLDKAAGLVAAYSLAGGQLRSTAVAVAGAGDWLIKVRASSATVEPTALLQRVQASLAAVRWPDELRRTAGNAVPVGGSPTALKPLKSARLVRDQGGAALINAVSVNAAKDGKNAPAQIFCRDPGQQAPVGAIYRPAAARDTYLLAVGDNGVGFFAAPDVLGRLLGNRDRRFKAELLTSGQTTGLGSFDALPSPKQLLALYEAGRFTYRVNSWGSNKNEITINPEVTR